MNSTLDMALFSFYVKYPELEPLAHSISTLVMIFQLIDLNSMVSEELQLKV